MRRRNRSIEEMNQLIEKFHLAYADMLKEQFCKQEKVSTSCFYRHLNRYQEANLLVRKPEPKFIELSQKEQIETKQKQNILIKLFGFKILSLEVVHV